MSALQEYKLNLVKNLNIKIKQSKSFLNIAKKSYEAARLNMLRDEIKIGLKNIKKYEDIIEESQKKIDDIESGELDDEMQNQLDIETMEREEKEEIYQQKLKKRRENKVHDKKILDKGWQREKNINRTNRKDKKDYDREYSRFERNSNSLPNYMKSNLADMPNNKGYIWKNIRFYGELPSQPNQPDVLFEKLRGGILRIHEITTHEHLIFEKRGRERKSLIKTIARRQRGNSTYSLMDFVN